MTTTWEHRLFWQDHVIEIIHTCGYHRQIGLDLRVTETAGGA